MRSKGAPEVLRRCSGGLFVLYNTQQYNICKIWSSPDSFYSFPEMLPFWSQFGLHLASRGRALVQLRNVRHLRMNIIPIRIISGKIKPLRILFRKYPISIPLSNLKIHRLGGPRNKKCTSSTSKCLSVWAKNILGSSLMMAHDGHTGQTAYPHVRHGA